MLNYPSAPFLVAIRLTNRCNLTCKHCIVSSSCSAEGELTTREWLSLFDELKSIKVFRLNLTGGEPLFRKDFPLLLENIANSHFAISINTNGTLLKRPLVLLIKSLLKNNLKLRHIQIGLDGSSPRTHDALRGKGTFERVRKAVENLRGEGIPFRFFCVVTRLNIADIPQVVSRCREWGGLSVELCPLVMTGRADEYKNHLALQARERKQLLETVISLNKDFPSFITGSFLYWAKILESAEIPVPVRGGKLQACSAGFTVAGIMADGSVIPCDAMPDVRAGNIKEKSFREIWHNSPVLQEIRSLPEISLEQI
ncbi:MAG: radical SAM protein, partial [Caldiserica bacterium]|nr:radical SAM protein [Caldisericota bacterium]